MVRVLWIDVDHCTVDEALDRCKTAGLPEPSILVASGNGVHLYWILAEAYVIDDAADPPPVLTEFIDQGETKRKIRGSTSRTPTARKSTSTARTSTMRPPSVPRPSTSKTFWPALPPKSAGTTLPTSADSSRIPGTLNRKDQRNGEKPKPCTLVKCDPRRRYPIDTFSQYAEASPDKVRREKVKKVQLPPVKKLSGRRADKLVELVNACAVADIGQRSETDFALCCYAIEQGIDRAEVWSRVADVGKFAEAGERYFEWTWKKAAQHTRERIFDKATGKGHKKSGKPKGTAEGDTDKPIIIIDTDEKRVVDQAISALATQENVYHRAGLLVQVVERGDSPKGIDRPKDAPHIVPMKQARIRELLATAAVWVKPTENDDESPFVHPPDWAVRAVDARGQWAGIRGLTAVVETPILRADGSILSQPGFDLATGIILRSDTTFDPPAHPTKDDAVAAVKALLEVVEDFPFAQPTHRAAWLAGTITPVARYAYHGPAPLTLIDANVRGCGKTLLTDATSLIVSARDMARMSLPRDNEEFRKRITAWRWRPSL